MFVTPARRDVEIKLGRTIGTAAAQAEYLPEEATSVYFISYARTDEDFALQLAEDLTSSGHEVWLDQLRLRPSEVWERQIEIALEESTTVVVVVTSESISSRNVLAEINYALELDKSVLPILVGDCKIPFRLRTIQSIDFRKDHKSALQRLLHHLSQTSSAKSPTPKPVAKEPPSLEPPGGKLEPEPRQLSQDIAREVESETATKLHLATNTQLTFNSLRDCLDTARFRQKLRINKAIDSEMLRNSIRNMSIDPATRIRALIDLTVFGSAKEALLFSDAGVLFIDRELQKTKALTYLQLKDSKFRQYAAPFVSKHVSIVELTVADSEEYRFGVAGGPMSGEELVELLSTLRSAANSAA